MEKEKERLITKVWNAVETLESIVFLGLMIIISFEWIEWIGRWVCGYKKRASTGEAHN